jgi:putative hydrolase of the HAD superfamily
MNLKDDRHCFACGPENPVGLRLADIRLEAQECVCSFTPGKPYQGWADILHGGITSTLLDEIMTHALWRQGLDAVTAEMTVRFRQPIPTGRRLEVRARITRRRGKLAETEAQITLPEGSVAASATAKFILTERGPDQPGGRLTLACREAVIFDLYGTLAPVYQAEAYLGVLAEVARVLGMAPEVFIPAFRADAPLRTTGRWPTLEGNLEDISRRLGRVPTPDQLAEGAAIRAEHSRQSLLQPYPDALVALTALRAAGRPVGLISDCSPETPALWAESPLAALIPAPVFSVTEGRRKPDPALYRLACERMGADPYRTVYVGDGDSSELAGARAVGILPILVDRGEESAFRVSQDRDVDVIVHDLTQVLPLVGVDG